MALRIVPKPERFWLFQHGIQAVTTRVPLCYAEMQRTEVFTLREGKVRLIYKIAQYEKSAEEYERPAEEYPRGGYLSICLSQPFFSHTLSYLLILDVFLLYFLERIPDAANVSIVLHFMLRCTVIYAVGLLFLELVTYLVPRQRYEEPTARREEHLRCLKRLKKRYDTEERIRELEEGESANA